jgi:hypothetical protein
MKSESKLTNKTAVSKRLIFNTSLCSKGYLLIQIVQELHSEANQLPNMRSEFNPLVEVVGRGFFPIVTKKGMAGLVLQTP